MFLLQGLAIVAFIEVAYAEDKEPCSDATRITDGFRRSVNYTIGMTGDENEEYICDQYLTPGWYIFEGHQGQNMPTFPPPLQKCGTLYPIWLNGTLPTDEDGVVQRKACSVDLNLDPCFLSYDIEIKKCRNEFAYYLPKTGGSCPEAFCIGEETPCPSGESSENGFTPGCTTDGFPRLLQDPIIDFTVGTYEDVQTYREVIMQCDVQHNESEIFVDVVWYMGDVKVAEHIGNESYNYSDLPAQIHEEEWFGKVKLDNNIRCEVKARYSRDTVPGPMRYTEYYMGMDVGNLNLEVEEGTNIPDYYTVKPTIPVLCAVGFESPELCFLAFYVTVPLDGDGPGTVCPTGEPIPQTVINGQYTGCEMRIPMVENPSENTTFNLSVYGTADGTFDGDRVVMLYLRSENNPMHRIWENYQLPPAYVTVIDRDWRIRTKYCYAHNDPHMITFDGRKYDNQLEGEFWLYRHKLYPSEIQVYFKDMGSYSKVCGAAVRSGGDLFIYDFCRDGAEGRIRLYECEDLELAINLDDDSDTVKIEFPHGTKVELTKTSVKVIPSLNDINGTEGLCGNFDLLCGNDFVGPWGREFVDICSPNPDCSNIHTCSRTREHKFANSWRVRKTESLYEGKIRKYRPKPEMIFCSCSEINGQSHTVCNVTNSPLYCVDGNITDLLPQCNSQSSFYMNGGSDDVVDEVGPFEYDPFFEPPEPVWNVPWNEQTARQECENFLRQVNSFDTCMDVPGVDYHTTISSCMEDIKITNETDFNIIHAGTFISLCLNQITRNMSYFDFNPDTGEVTLPYNMTDDICPSNCYNRGTCKKGECQCDDGYFGRECFYEENKVPTLYNIPNGGMCDLQSRPCQQTPVTGSYFLNKPSLSCHTEPIMLKTSGERVPQGETITKPQFDHMERIMCPLPLVTINYEEDDLFTFGYTIAVSNDGVAQSDKRKMTTYDSLCMNCTIDLSCIHLANTCLLQGTCYSNGQLSNKDPCLMCDATTNSWAEVMTDACQPKTGLIAGITVLVVASAASAVIGVVIIKKTKKAKVDVVCEVELNGVDNEDETTGSPEKACE